ncbi:MAG: TIM barrel protein [Clostridia bacterium]|nr:TIM barrel protein [Clostridia bacterium]
MIKLCAFADEASSELMGQITALKRNNISLLELRSINEKNVADFSFDDAKNYKTQLDNEGIKVWSIGSPLGKVDINIDFNKYLDICKKVFEIANIMGTKNIRAFSFFNAYNDKNRVFDYLNKMSDIAKEYDVFLCHENEKEVYGDTLKRVKEIMANVRDWKYIYDPANFVQCGEVADETLFQLFNKIYYFHIKDVISATDEMVPAGYGDGKIDKLVSMITDDKVLSIEPHLFTFDAYKNIDNTEMKTKFKFRNNDEAFDAAVRGIKNILQKCNYNEEKYGFTT